MISLSNFRMHAFQFFALSKITDIGLEVVNNGVVFDVLIKKTDKKPKLHRTKRKPRLGISPEYLTMDTCKVCGELSVAGLCLNKKCTNSHL